MVSKNNKVAIELLKIARLRNHSFNFFCQWKKSIFKTKINELSFFSFIIRNYYFVYYFWTDSFLKNFKNSNIDSHWLLVNILDHDDSQPDSSKKSSTAFSFQYSNFPTRNLLRNFKHDFIQMVYFYELSVDLQISHIFFLMIRLWSKFKSERSLTLPYFLWKSHLWKFVNRFLHADR